MELFYFSIDCVSVNVLVVRVFYSFARWSYWGKLGKGTQDLCIISYNCI
jgi:hypothetical protein